MAEGAEMTISRTPEWEAKLKAHVAVHGPFMIFKTLLGGDPDHNRRTIQNLLTGEKMATFNRGMHEWTSDMEDEVNTLAKQLNDAYLADQNLPCHHRNTEDHETFQKCVDCGAIFPGRKIEPEAT